MVNYNNPYLMNNPYMQTTAPDSFVGVQNEHEARIYPVAPGKSVTFRDESQPTIFYTKTGGASPLDAPVFEKYKLVKEEAPAAAIEATETPSKDKVLEAPRPRPEPAGWHSDTAHTKLEPSPCPAKN